MPHSLLIEFCATRTVSKTHSSRTLDRHRELLHRYWSV